MPEGQQGARFITEMRELDAVSKSLKAMGWQVTASEMRYLAKNFPELDEQAKKEVADFLNAIDDRLIGAGSFTVAPSASSGAR